jgi:prepilin-type N-terminal cleavage/methylation domain-containing protein
MEGQWLLRIEPSGGPPALPGRHLQKMIRKTPACIALRAIRVNSGVSLLEILVCVSIIAALATMLAPSLRQTKVEARRIEDTAKLRQVGQALALYQISYDERCWFEVEPLVESQMLDPLLAASELDPHPRGLLNHIRFTRYHWREEDLTGFKDSFLSYHLPERRSDYNTARFLGPFGASKGAGWLVALDTPLGLWGWDWFESPGGYLRLTMDGAVLRRRIRVDRLGSTGIVARTSWCWMFTDDLEACRLKIL